MNDPFTRAPLLVQQIVVQTFRFNLAPKALRHQYELICELQSNMKMNHGRMHGFTSYGLEKCENFALKIQVRGSSNIVQDIVFVTYGLFVCNHALNFQFMVGSKNVCRYRYL